MVRADAAAGNGLLVWRGQVILHVDVAREEASLAPLEPFMSAEVCGPRAGPPILKTGRRLQRGWRCPGAVYHRLNWFPLRTIRLPLYCLACGLGAHRAAHTDSVFVHFDGAGEHRP